MREEPKSKNSGRMRIYICGRSCSHLHWEAQCKEGSALYESPVWGMLRNGLEIPAVKSKSMALRLRVQGLDLEWVRRLT